MVRYGYPFLIGLVALVVFGVVAGSRPVATSAPSAGPGCAGCHVAGKARTLDAALKTIKDHPAVSTSNLVVCQACHKAGGKAAPLGQVLHRRHLGASAFASTFKGTCTSCHAVDLKTGRVTVIGLPPRSP